MYFEKACPNAPLFTDATELPEISELDCELKQLRKWTCMLSELQHTAVVVRMIQETSMSQIRFLKEALILREAELRVVEPLTPDYSPSSTHAIDCGPWNSPGSVSSTTTRSTDSSRASMSQSQKTAHIPVAHDRRIVPSGQLSYDTSPAPTSLQPGAAVSFSSTRNLTLHPRAVHKSIQDSETQANAQLDLIRLTTFLPLTGKSPQKRRRIVPPYPRDERDPRWLFNWLYELRLHKYLPELQGLTPSELLELEGEEDLLIERGIASVGARRRLLESLREAKDQIRASDELGRSEHVAD
ncbi:unnamed protein product [Diplocarpon coronariae]|uniref:SAM domain-containing protein n=1 Tax=Diplocarpon coronariae TaxID=2795749 RepID=A0A218ZDX9_9HELO|nr:hypothetical protein B2J93_8118 [Marssonina coronariae]